MTLNLKMIIEGGGGEKNGGHHQVHPRAPHQRQGREGDRQLIM